MNMNNKVEFPPDEKYIDLICRLSEINKNERYLNLTTGNCGVFAIALKKIFDDGELINLEEGCHVLYKRGNKIYDGESLYQSIEDLRDSFWGKYMRRVETIPILDNYMEQHIKNQTNYNMEPEEFIEIIKETLQIGD